MLGLPTYGKLLWLLLMRDCRGATTTSSQKRVRRTILAFATGSSVADLHCASSMLLNDSCGEKSKRCMPPHALSGRFNMALCIACAQKPAAHTVAEAGKRCSARKQSPYVAVLWLPQTRHTHIKNESRKRRVILCRRSISQPIVGAFGLGRWGT